MAKISDTTVTAVYEHALAVATQKNFIEFTVTDVSDGWSGSDTTFRTAITELGRDGRLTQVGIAKLKGAPKIYSITEMLEALTAPSGENRNVAKSKAALKAVTKQDTDALMLIAEFASVLGMEMNESTAPLYFEGLKAQIIHLVERIDSIAQAQITNNKRSLATSDVVSGNADRLMEHYAVFTEAIAKLRADHEELLRRVKLDRGDWERALDKRAAVETRNAEDIQPGPFRASNKQYVPTEQNQQNNSGFRDGYRIGFADGLKMQTLLLGNI